MWRRQKTDLSLGLAESFGGVDGHIGVEALADGGDGGKRRADFKRDAREDQLLAAGRGDGLGDLRQRTLLPRLGTSALGGKADIRDPLANVRL
jgi:hypothetical protein